MTEQSSNASVKSIWQHTIAQSMSYFSCHAFHCISCISFMLPQQPCAAVLPFAERRPASHSQAASAEVVHADAELPQATATPRELSQSAVLIRNLPVSESVVARAAEVMSARINQQATQAPAAGSGFHIVYPTRQTDPLPSLRPPHSAPGAPRPRLDPSPHQTGPPSLKGHSPQAGVAAPWFATLQDPNAQVRAQPAAFSAATEQEFASNDALANAMRYYQREV